MRLSLEQTDVYLIECCLNWSHFNAIILTNGWYMNKYSIDCGIKLMFTNKGWLFTHVYLFLSKHPLTSLPPYICIYLFSQIRRLWATANHFLQHLFKKRREVATKRKNTFYLNGTIFFFFFFTRLIYVTAFLQFSKGDTRWSHFAKKQSSSSVINAPVDSSSARRCLVEFT